MNSIAGPAEAGPPRGLAMESPDDSELEAHRYSLPNRPEHGTMASKENPKWVETTC